MDAILQSAVQDAGYDLLVDTGEDVTNKAEEIRLARYRKIKRRTVVALLLSLPIMDMTYIFQTSSKGFSLCSFKRLNWLGEMPVILRNCVLKWAALE